MLLVCTELLSELGDIVLFIATHTTHIDITILVTAPMRMVDVCNVRWNVAVCVAPFQTLSSSSNITCVYNTPHNMPTMEVQVNRRNETKELIGSNGVHPTMNGYLQIGDVFYRALVADMKNEK